MLKIVILLLYTSCLPNQIVVVSLKSQPTHERTLGINRQKRNLFVNGPNIVKSVLGVSFPVDLADVVNYRKLNMAYNFQAQYTVNPSAMPPWTLFKRSLRSPRSQHSKNKTCCNDGTRHMIYNALEIIMLRKGINGKECLLRAICENAQSEIRVTGIFHEILNLFLSPTENEDDTDYMDAKEAGASGIYCLHLYKNCPMGHGFLDSISEFVHYKV